MKNRFFTLFCFLLGLVSFTANAQIISVTPGTDFNVATGTIVSLENLQLTPSADFSLNTGVALNTTATNSITNTAISHYYKFGATTNAFSGVLKINYNEADLNGLTESNLKLLYHTGSTWTINTGSTGNAVANYVSASFNAMPLNELSLGAYATTSLLISQCGATLETPTSDIVCYSMPDATGYTFAITYNGVTYYVVSADPVINLAEATGMPLDFNASYAISVRVQYGNAESNYGAVCTVNSPVYQATQLSTVSCGATLASIGSLVYADINLNATGYRFKVVNNTTGEIQYVDNTHHWFALNWLASYEYATTYTVSVQLQIAGTWLGYYGTTCTVNTPNITSETGSLQLVSTQCGATLPSIASVIYTTAQAGATGYRFRITDVTSGATGANLLQVKDRSYHWFALTMLTRYNYGSTYMVEVAVKTTSGYTGYGSPCYVNTPASPMLNNCGAVIPTSRTLVYTAITKSVTQYRFQVTKVSDQSSRTFDTGRFWFSFKVNMPGYTPSVAYSVRVAVMTSGTWSPFGDACEITSPAIPRSDINAEFDFNATVFPNPYSDQFSLRIDSDSFDRIAYKVYDMLGKLIEAEEVEFNDLETKEFGRNYPAGVYNIVVSQGEDVKTLRVIKR